MNIEIALLQPVMQYMTGDKSSRVLEVQPGLGVRSGQRFLCGHGEILVDT